MNLRISSLRLALLALALTASRAFGDAHCVDDIRKAGPNGSFCSGSSGPPPSAASASPAAASQLNSMAAGAVGGAVGSILGNALVTPLANPYKGRVPVKPVVGDDEDVFKTHPIGITAADDIIGNYTAQDNSYAGRLNHFRQLHDAEMDKRRDALELIRGTSAEKWCAAHINILFPSPPVSDVLNRYENTVRAYDREKQTWDKRCGGPSVMPGYESFTEGLAALKPDAVPGAASPAQQASAVKTTAPTYSEPDEPAKTTGPSKAADDDELLPTPAQTKTPSKTAEAPAAPDEAVIAPPPAAPADAAPAQGAAGSSDANTNHSTEFFGIKNANVTQADLQDQRAPDLTSNGKASPGAPSSAAGTHWAGIPNAKGMPNGPAPDSPVGWGTPEQIGSMLSGGRSPTSPDTGEYIRRAAKFLKQSAADKIQEELDKNFALEMVGLEGRILYNATKLPGYILPRVMSAATGDLTQGQAENLTLGAANVLYNVGSPPNEVIAKIADEGDAATGFAVYAKDKATDAIVDMGKDAALDSFSSLAGTAAVKIQYRNVPRDKADLGSQWVEHVVDVKGQILSEQLRKAAPGGVAAGNTAINAVNAVFYNAPPADQESPK